MASAEASSLKVQPKVTIGALLEAWEREHSAAGGSARSADDWRRCINAFIKHLGHDDATAVSPKAVSDFADHLRHERGLSAKTINGRYLAALGAVYRLGIRKHLVSENPSEHVKVSADKPRQVRSKGFTESEARAVLTAALRSTDTALRWLPFLAAYTGARIGELVQLRRDDFLEEDGHAFVRLTPEAGSVKTGAYRDVPLHPALIDAGILAFVAKHKGKGSLFPSNSAQRVARFVKRVLDLPAGRGLSPNHAWRHRFKTIAREAGLDLRAADAIQGHADGSASGGYGEWTVRFSTASWSSCQPCNSKTTEEASRKDTSPAIACCATPRRARARASPPEGSRCAHGPAPPPSPAIVRLPVLDAAALQRRADRLRSDPIKVRGEPLRQPIEASTERDWTNSLVACRSPLALAGSLAAHWSKASRSATPRLTIRCPIASWAASNAAETRDRASSTSIPASSATR